MTDQEKSYSIYFAGGLFNHVRGVGPFLKKLI